ncbi:MAG: Tm-1-like ATP-binding domain-containing protein [Planctomycetaceae bacterium]
MAVYLVGTLDTKGTELAWVRTRLQAGGIRCVVVDAGCIGVPAFTADVSSEQVYEAAGTTLAEQQSKRDRGHAVTLAAEGVRRILLQAEADGQVDGILALGGSAGTTIGTTAMRSLNLGIPKIMVSTMASGQTRPYVGGRNIWMLNSVVDIAGINRISRMVLGQAVDAMVGMVKGQELTAIDTAADRPLIAATMFGVTTPCVTHARSILEAAGYEVLVFHATGNGGEAMEGLIRDGMLAGVLDLTTTELADELVGGVLSAGPDRLTAAADTGVPQVISVGALDMVNFGPSETIPDRFSKRQFHRHNPTVTLMRTTMDECQELGREIGRKASRSKAPVSILFPSLGVSALDLDGQPFDNWAARMALWEGICSAAESHVDLQLRQEHINSPDFAEAAAHQLLRMLNERPAK